MVIPWKRRFASFYAKHFTSHRMQGLGVAYGIDSQTREASSSKCLLELISLLIRMVLDKRFLSLPLMLRTNPLKNLAKIDTRALADGVEVVIQPVGDGFAAEVT
ncbi:hypothetical protein ADS46_17200 [Halomonas sp. G11]|nr:hypothetical protein ADS46_17200 [Halomonas sp. G11]